jgi:hypothetical protein
MSWIMGARTVSYQEDGVSLFCLPSLLSKEGPHPWARHEWLRNIDRGFTYLPLSGKDPRYDAFMDNVVKASLFSKAIRVHGFNLT